jgi:asparagine synthase (glutamine-hydrolysing)
MVDDVLVNGELTSSGFLDRQGVKRLVEDERTGREDRSKQLWQLLTLELWVRNARSLGVAG